MAFAFSEYGEHDPKPYEIRADGIYTSEGFRQASPSGIVFDWTPADDMQGPSAPNPGTAPFLPIPFTAAQLAAAMLDGPGQAIQHALERRIGHPLDDEALEGFPARKRWTRDAIAQAYALAAQAQSVVGEFDHAAEARAHALAQQYDEANGQANEREGVFAHGVDEGERRARRERAAASVLPLRLAARQAQEFVSHAWRQWRADMVRQLLEPAQPTPTDAHEQAVQEAHCIIAFYSGTLDIEQWARHPAVAPAQAARLLCSCDPLSEDASNRNAQILAHLFESWSTCHPGPRTLAQWAHIAREQDARHSAGIGRAVEYLAGQTGSAPSEAPAPKPAHQTPQQRKEARQAQRWQECIDAGLTMPTDTYAAYPPGINVVAERLGIRRQSLAEDLDAYRERFFSRQQ